MKKPIQRSYLRRQAGKIYYQVRKLWYWYFSGTHFARQETTIQAPFIIYQHQTPIMRKLKDVDKWMQENKRVNLEHALKKVHAITLRPGEVFSYWRSIGKPTRRKGYVEGMVLRDGKVVTGIGGGLCQLSNLIFWITAHTPLTIIERWRHSYDVFPDVKREKPFGSGATCAYPYIDLQIKNITDQTFQLQVTIVDDQLVGAWHSDRDTSFTYTIFEKDHHINGEWWGGYTRHNTLWREVYAKETQEKVKEEFLLENHAIMMYEPLLEEGSRP